MANIETLAADTRYFAEVAAPSTPSSGQAVLYVKSDGKIYLKDDAGTETDLTASGASLGAWTTNVPTWSTTGSAPSIGNGTLTARYKALDASTYAYYLYLAFGSTTSAGTGTWTFTLPFTPVTGRNQLLAGYIFDSGTDHKIAVARLTGGSATIPDVCPEGGNVITNTVPMTWANGDTLILQGVVEV